MNATELNEIMNSDMKLWERAETETKDSNSTVKKSLDLPHGIGLYSITFTGVTDAEKRRSAMQQWGDFVRAEVQNRIDDEAVSARAAQRAAKVSEDASRRDAEHGGGASGAASVPNTEAVPAHEPNPFTSREAAASRINECRGRIDYYTAQLEELRLEMKALTAFAEVMGWELVGYDNAPKDEGTKIESNED